MRLYSDPKKNDSSQMPAYGLGNEELIKPLVGSHFSTVDVDDRRSQIHSSRLDGDHQRNGEYPFSFNRSTLWSSSVSPAYSASIADLKGRKEMIAKLRAEKHAPLHRTQRESITHQFDTTYSFSLPVGRREEEIYRTTMDD
ncbi:hypothetical protein ADUPG1_008522 [Aduncisulcus paluster]|uniref:Uncharacterized protein n=1 Tax=Aduncisulcus paluster TaxID=2918883 RepID=A0ABQ5KTL4_9EUKA|nr:hypothetical protein ADUPG1_008522 [Aduncisulcus paluster]